MVNNEDKEWFLATTANESFWDTSKPILFLGEWCQRYSQRAHWEGLEGLLLEGPFDNTESLNKAYRFVGEVYEHVLPLLGDALNELHATEYGNRYWRIVIGPWLYWYITVIYDRYLCLKGALADYPGLVTIGLSECSFVTPSNTIEFVNLVRSDLFNLQIYTNILAALGKEFPRKSTQVESTHGGNKTLASLWKIKIRAVISRVFSSITAHATPSIVLHNTYFSRACEFWLALRAAGRILPNFGFEPSVREPSLRNDTPYNRSNMKQIPLGNGEFEKCLSSGLSMDIPKCFFENFKAIDAKAKIFYSKPIKAIFSANSWYFDEVFKQFAASSAENGTLLLGTSHGGDYGGLCLMAAEDHETAIVDCYYSWGWNRDNCKATVIPMPATKLMGRKKISANNSGVGALWVITTSSRYLLELPFTPKLFDEYLSWQCRFVKTLREDIVSEISVRPHFSDHGWDIVQRLKDCIPHIPVETWGVPFQQRLRECRLYICDHLSTTFAEALAINKPTILFWNPQANELRPEAQFYYDLLRSNGILFDTPEVAAAAVNDVYYDVKTWWNQPDRQAAIQIFCEQFARTSPNAIALWDEELRKY
ncbi:LIC12162 family protein [Synechococcus sp. AH-551-E11]|nr:LIC12162 family protein [Synechococcus sp. AH-551-E11]MDB4616935.1 LIC12162 family protein [Synechococcus sp. AH-551-E11]